MGEGSRDGLGELKVEGGFGKRGVVEARISGGGKAAICWASCFLGSTPSSALACSVFASLSPVEVLVSRVSSSSANNAMLENWTFVIGPRQYLVMVNPGWYLTYCDYLPYGNWSDSLLIGG